MKNRLIRLSIGLFCWLPCRLNAQHIPPVTIKLDLAAPLHRAVGGALEWRLSPRTSLEGRVQGEWYPYNKQEVFEGNWVQHYSVRRIDSINYLYHEQVNAPDLLYVGDARPLPPSPGMQVPVSTWQFSLGYRFEYGKKWRWFLQPGMTLSQHRYMLVKDRLLLEGETLRRWNDAITRLLITQQTQNIRQERIMRAQEKWFGGIRYDMGLLRQLGNRFYVEARGAAALHYFVPYRVRAPRAVRELSIQYALMIGYRLGA